MSLNSPLRAGLAALLATVTSCAACSSTAEEPERQPAVATPPAPETDPDEVHIVRVDGSEGRGPLGRVFRPSAMLTFADREALAEFIALPGPLGTVRIGLEPALGGTRSLDEYRAELRQLGPLLRTLEERGAAVVIGFAKTPRWLSSEDTRRQLPGSGWLAREATPPRDLAGLEEIAFETVQILNGEFGLALYYEFWNEPNSPAFWRGTLDQLFRTYAAFALGARRADPAAKVGGLAVGSADAVRQPDGQTDAPPVLQDFLSFVARPPADVNGGARLPLDFVSWHCFSRLPWEGWQYSATAVRNWLAAAGLPEDLPQLVTEWALWREFPEPSDAARDQVEGAAYLIAALQHIESAGVWGHSIAALQDFQSAPADDLFSGGFGLLTRDPDVRKSAFSALELLGRLGDRRVQSEIQAPAIGHGIGALASAATGSCAILLHRFPVVPRIAAERVLRAAGFRQVGELGLSSDEATSFLEGTGALPAAISERARGALEGARVAAQRAPSAPARVRVELQVQGCPAAQHTIYRIEPGRADPALAYRAARANGLAHAEAVERARSAARLDPQRGTGIPREIELGYYALALVVLE